LGKSGKKRRKVRCRDGTRERKTDRKSALATNRRRMTVEEWIVRALSEQVALEIDREIIKELTDAMNQWDERGIMKDVNRLIVDAAMRWTKHVKAETPQGDFLKAQSDLVLICNIKRFLEPYVGA